MTNLKTNLSERLALYPLERMIEALEHHDCQMCGAPNGFVYDYGGGLNPSVFCPKCAHAVALSDAAQDQLERLLIPVVAAWAAHWGEVLQVTGKFASVSSILMGLGESFERITAPALEGLNPEA